uniref:Uncharacterized protein n=1 Tax=Saccharolobus islandicus TaxID=43080 RepID=Q5W2P2_SACIS|nr:hypothetical protein [Sulfolobus islandicus]CAG38254.1 hypothetical protein [Sulfolobus islandicus]
MSEFDRFINCWLKFRRVYSVKDLDDDCKHVMCVFLLKIKEDDESFIDDLEIREDVEYCERVERKIILGVV